MAITLRSRREIELMRKAGSVVGNVHRKLKEMAQPGISTGELDRVAARMAKEAGSVALFKGVRSPHASVPFPGAICASVNDEVVHGIPSDKTILEEGDVLSVDYGIELNGYCGDSARTLAIGKVSDGDRHLMDVTEEVLEIAIAECRPGILWSQVAAKMEQRAKEAGWGVVRDFVGNGIGTQLQEDPRVRN